MMKLAVGDIVQQPSSDEPFEVIQLEELPSGYVHIVGLMCRSRAGVDWVLSPEQVAQLRRFDRATAFQADPRHVFLALEAQRYRLASLYDPLLAMNTSKVDPLPHQIEAVYGYVLKWPRIRFLIADDPGAGKTIMAGLIIKELKLRRLADRILIVAPGHLKDQWRREMKERFEESFVVVDRSMLDALYGQNIWARESQVITSLDFAKQEDVLAGLASVTFDLVIVDEAHKLAAYRYGDKLDKTVRYRLGECLSQIATHLLFLTATPHRGDPENFRLFLDLLEPGFFASADLMNESICQKDNPLFIRRIKEDLKDFQGRPLFLPRHVNTLSFNLGAESPEEKQLYNALSRYVQEQYNRALHKQDKRRNVAFALVILQRRLASSTYALLRSLERRKKRLEDLLRGAERKGGDDGYDPDEAEELSEAERWQREEAWEAVSTAENRYELEQELRTLDDLIARARAIVAADPPAELKLQRFKTALERLLRDHPNQKVLVFTESRDTLEYLDRNLRRWGYSVCTIHGGMDLETRIAAERVFRNEAQIMVATEAAGEGINLQFCHLMLNYDIPWNPNRLEQRMGRIHRYGQTREVFIVNLVAEDTREGMVLRRLFDKLEEIRRALGSDKVFDVLGDILRGRDLGQLMAEAAANARNLDDILREIEIKVDADYLRRIREELGESLATRFIDYTRIREMAAQAREHRLIPEYTQAFFAKAMEALGAKLTAPKGAAEGILSLESVPAPLRDIGETDDFKKRFGVLMRRYTQITFDKDIALRHPRAELVTFGHPLFEAVLLWTERRLADALQQGARFTDPDGRYDGTLLFFEGEIRDGQNAVAGKRLFAVFADRAQETLRLVNPAILWDFQEGAPNASADPTDAAQAPDALRRKAIEALLPALEAYRAALLDERRRQADIKAKYGLKSLEHLILKLDGDLIGLYDRHNHGENVDLAIRNKEEQKQRYERAMEALKQSLERERALTLSMPRLVGAVRVTPAAAPPPLASDAEVERIGMATAMAYERSCGYVPEDVSAENLGFDIRSTAPNGERRYIEVKARADQGGVALTQNEWFKAQRFGDAYWLYVVLNAASQPTLYRIQNPARALHPHRSMEVRYFIALDEIAACSAPSDAAPASPSPSPQGGVSQ
ncbi:MAG: helicase-related protein [Thermoflexales bacterium]|nr:helicase-related protein [Thermoflexales bacterium]